MKSDKIKAIVVKKLSFRYPKYPIQFEHVEGDHNLIGVGVFSVPDSDYEEINDYILDLSFELQEDGIMPPEVDLIPFVRDVKTTALHYPDIKTSATSGYKLKAVEPCLLRAQEAQEHYLR